MGSQSIQLIVLGSEEPQAVLAALPFCPVPCCGLSPTGSAPGGLAGSWTCLFLWPSALAHTFQRVPPLPREQTLNPLVTLGTGFAYKLLL